MSARHVTTRCRRVFKPLLILLAGIGVLLPAGSAWAANNFLTIANGANGESWSLPVQTLVFLTSLTFLPAILLMMTGFTRIIVLGLLRNALGTASTPPNQVLLGLALFLTFYIMSPVFQQIYDEAWEPLSKDKISM